MLKLLGTLFTTAGSALKSRRDLAMENLALRQQLAILKRERPRPQLTDPDRLFWVLLSKIWTDWAEALLIIKPETVIRWHRKGFKWFWRRKSQRRVPQSVHSPSPWLTSDGRPANQSRGSFRLTSPTAAQSTTFSENRGFVGRSFRVFSRIRVTWMSELEFWPRTTYYSRYF